MKNNKGQALIEFTMILPVILLLIIYIIEFGKITLKKIELESNMDLIVTLYEEKKQDDINSYINQNNIHISYIKENELTTLILTKNIDSKLPLVNRIIGNIETRRTIYEKNE